MEHVDTVTVQSWMKTSKNFSRCEIFMRGKGVRIEEVEKWMTWKEKILEIKKLEIEGSIVERKKDGQESWE